MKHVKIDLPFSKNDLEPYMGQETLEYHYEKHHEAYVAALNTLIIDTEFEDLSLEEIILSSHGKIFNNAAQTWNHNFFWNSLKKNNGAMPSEKLLQIIEKNFGSFQTMQEVFKISALGQFGSGWTWLVQKDEILEIYATPNGENPLTHGGNPLIGLDVWEHSYYLDYRNNRAEYIDNFWNIVNWDVVGERMN